MTLTLWFFKTYDLNQISKSEDMHFAEKKEKLLILSDLNGLQNAAWISYYTSFLKEKFEIEILDSCVLAEIDSNVSKEKIHKQMISFGIEKAVLNLLKREEKPKHILGFSIGGTIGWKANSSDLNLKSLFAVSATRIRFETQKPKGILKTFFGENDAFKPDLNWFKEMEIDHFEIPEETHEFYKKKEFATQICTLILTTLENESKII